MYIKKRKRKKPLHLYLFQRTTIILCLSMMLHRPQFTALCTPEFSTMIISVPTDMTYTNPSNIFRHRSIKNVCILSFYVRKWPHHTLSYLSSTSILVRNKYYINLSLFSSAWIKAWEDVNWFNSPSDACKGLLLSSPGLHSLPFTQE